MNAIHVVLEAAIDRADSVSDAPEEYKAAYIQGCAETAAAFASILYSQDPELYGLIGVGDALTLLTDGPGTLADILKSRRADSIDIEPIALHFLHKMDAYRA